MHPLTDKDHAHQLHTDFPTRLLNFTTNHRLYSILSKNLNRLLTDKAEY